MPFRHLLSDQSSLTSDDVSRLGELTAEWQLLADISFADLAPQLPSGVNPLLNFSLRLFCNCIIF